jgi:hypothetical protein
VATAWGLFRNLDSIPIRSSLQEFQEKRRCVSVLLPQLGTALTLRGNFSMKVGLLRKKRPAHIAMVQGEERDSITDCIWEDTMAPYKSCRSMDTNLLLAHNQVGRHWVYSGHDPRIFVAPKNARNSEIKHWSGAVPMPLLALSASTTSAYTSLGVLQELNPRPQLLKESGLPLSHISCHNEWLKS